MITAGDGTDTITGGPGTDTVTGGRGNDTINVFDGERDSVDCQILGDNVVNADQLDVYNKVDCAQVNVKQFGTCASGQTGTPPNCTSPPPPSTAKVSLSLPSHQTPAKSKKLLATVKCSAACFMGAFAEVKIGSAKPFEVDSKVAHLTAAGSKTIPLEFSKKQLKKIEGGLRAHKKVLVAIKALLTNSSASKVLAASGSKILRIKS
jgi:hypothetical protein